MKEKLLLVGGGGLGRAVLEHASVKYDCAFLDDGHTVGSLIDGTPVIGSIRDLDQLFPEYRQLVITIGNNSLRQKVYERAAVTGYEFPNIIVSTAYISPHSVLGTGCIILNNAVIQNNAHIGNGCILNAGVEAHQDSFIGNYCLIYTNSVIRSLAKVGDRVRVGSLVTISNRAVINDDADIPDGAVCQ